MAEETLKYKLDIDDSDFAQKLSDISARINASVTNAFSGAGVPGYMSTPGAAQFVSPFEQPVMVPPTPNFSAYNPGGFLDTSRGFALNTFGNVQTGFNMATRDLGLHSNNIIADYEKDRTPDFTGGYFSSMAGALGIGYDPTMPLSGADYRAQNARQMSNSIKGFGSTVTDVGIGIGASIAGTAALGAIGVAGFPLFAAAAAIGFGANATMDFVMADQKAMEDFSGGVLKTGAQYLPGYSQSQAMDFSRKVFDYTKTEVAKIEGIDMNTAGNTLLGFTAAGGFSGVSSPQEFETKAMGAIENMRSFMRTFNMFQEEAVKLMGELDNRGIMGAENGGSFAAKMGGLGSMYGINPTSLVSQMVSTADALTPFGYDPKVSANFALDARLEMQRMDQSYDPYSRKAIFTLGGTEAATNGFIQDSVNMGGTRLGTLFTATALGGGDPYGGTIQGVSAAANFYSNPTNYFSQLHDQQGMWEKVMGGENASLGMSNFLVGKAMQDLQLVGQGYGENGKMDQSAVKGYMMQLAKNVGIDMSSAKADMMMQMVINGANTDYNMVQAGEAGATMVEGINNRPMDTVFAKLGRELGSTRNLLGMTGGIIGGVIGGLAGMGFGSLVTGAAGATLGSNLGVRLYDAGKQIGDLYGEDISGMHDYLDNVVESVGDNFTGTTRIRASKDGYSKVASNRAMQILENFSTSNVLREAITLENSRLTDPEEIKLLGESGASIDQKLRLRLTKGGAFKEAGATGSLTMDQMNVISQKYTGKDYADASDTQRATMFTTAKIMGYEGSQSEGPDYQDALEEVSNKKKASAMSSAADVITKNMDILGLKADKVSGVLLEMINGDPRDRYDRVKKLLPSKNKYGGNTSDAVDALISGGDLSAFEESLAESQAAKVSGEEMKEIESTLRAKGVKDPGTMALAISQDVMRLKARGIDWTGNMTDMGTAEGAAAYKSKLAQVGTSTDEQTLRAQHLAGQLEGTSKTAADALFNDSNRNVSKLVDILDSVRNLTLGGSVLKVQVFNQTDDGKGFEANKW